MKPIKHAWMLRGRDYADMRYQCLHCGAVKISHRGRGNFAVLRYRTAAGQVTLLNPVCARLPEEVLP